MIKNLSQLKKALQKGTRLEIVHHCRPECIGMTKEVTLANTQGFYSIAPDCPELNKGNSGLGPVLWWSKAPFWGFENGVCSVYHSDKEHTQAQLIVSFRVLEEAS